MLPSEQLGTPEPLVPSSLSRLLYLKRREFEEPASSVQTTEVATFFNMTAVEAHNALSQFAADGLLSFKDVVNDVETWELSRDGAYVFRARVKRITKKQLSTVQTMLIGLGASLLSQGALELSMGGRPVTGKANGMLLVGVRVGHEPFSTPSDALIFEQIGSALAVVLDNPCYTVMLFKDAVPERLRIRTILTGAHTGRSAESEKSLLDIDEKLQRTYRTAYAHLRGVDDPDMVHDYTWGSNIPVEVRSFLNLERRFEKFPVSCRQSPVVISDYQTISSDTALFDQLSLTERKMRYLSADISGPNADLRFQSLIVVADYSAVTGKLERLAERICVMLNGESTRTSLRVTQESLLFHINERRVALQTRRDEKAKRKSERPHFAVHYFTYFDTLNFPEPVLVGMARQPASHNGNVEVLAGRWNIQMRQKEDSPAAFLGKWEYASDTLSLDRRLANSSEIAAFDRLSKSAGVTLKCLLTSPDKATGYSGFRGRNEYPFSERPREFRTAELGRSPHPRLLSSREYPYGSLFSLIEQAPIQHRAALAANIVDVDTISTEDFVRAASVRPCNSPVVLASRLLDNWVFSSRPDGWAAALVGDDWAVTLAYADAALRLHARFGNRTHVAQIHPVDVSDDRFFQPYLGSISSLLPFMERMAAAKSIDLQATFKANDTGDEHEDDPGIFEWFLDVVSDALRGWSLFFGYSPFGESHISWPPFTSADETTP